jgi:transcriptional regulator with PAS, ATPase and Fis domain/CHASE2 domain-containing sensor protein
MKNLFLPSNRNIALLSIIIIFIFLILGDLPWDDTLNNSILHWQYQIRGQRSLSDKIVLIYIDANNIEALQGWPITRDYYGYLIYVLNQTGIKAVGFDILFDNLDKRYPEYDETLADFFSSYKNVCLPMAFSEVEFKQESDNPTDSKLLKGNYPVFPVDTFRKRAAGIGFSNLSNETIINKIPLVMTYNDTLIHSFGLELARIFLDIPDSSITIKVGKICLKSPEQKRFCLPVDRNGNMYMNHSGGIENIHSINFLDLLHTFRNNRDSIHLAGKLAIVAVTAPGYSTLKATPLAAAIPAVMIHATVSENIIEQNYLQIIPKTYQLLSMLILVFVSLGILRIRKISIKIAAIILLIVFYLLIIHVLFSRENLILPFFYPGLALITILICNFLTYKYQFKQEADLQKKFFSDQIADKQRVLDKTEQELLNLQEKYKKEVKTKEFLSQDYQRLVEKSKNEILELEKQITDLQSYTIQDKKSSKIKIPEFIYAEKSKIIEVLDLIDKVSSDDISVLIMGETGSGKELSARAIHNLSKRNKGPFIAVNCGALTETLLESELFGHEKGSFTGAYNQRKGRFELANEGTIFLDEITETSPAFQVKLLRTLQEKIIERIGSENSIKVNVRVISATSKNIEDEIKAGNFREDLFYRLNGFSITLPALRERKDDIPLLAVHFLQKYEYKFVTKFSDQVMEYMKNYNWPGNVRQLENVVRRCAILAQSEGRDMIQVKDLPDDIRMTGPDLLHYQSFEEQLLELLRSLKFKHTAITQAAKILGNRDRGTITEYFRGICFEYFVHSKFDPELTLKTVAGTDDRETQNRVKEKLTDYLKNLDITKNMDGEENEQLIRHSMFKGLPKKYHEHLLHIIRYFSREIDRYQQIISRDGF